jgi:hypothetical protein
LACDLVCEQGCNPRPQFLLVDPVLSKGRNSKMKNHTKSHREQSTATADRNSISAGLATLKAGAGLTIRLKKRARDAGANNHVTPVTTSRTALEVNMTRAQLQFISVCLEYATSFTDEHLNYRRDRLQRSAGLWGRWDRDQQRRKAVIVWGDAYSKQLRKRIAAHDARLTADAYGIAK